MRRRQFGFVGLAVLFLLAMGIGNSMRAATKAELMAKINQADGALKKAATLYKTKNYDKAAEYVQQAQGLLAEVSADPGGKEVARFVKPIQTRLKKAHGLLEIEGATLMPLEEPSAEGGTTGGAGQVSFVKDVAPILVAKCGRCHVNAARGGTSMATFEALEKGNADGVIVMAGKGKGSRIVEVIESGDMPRGGGKVSAEELGKLTTWIDQGARYDGKSKAEQLTLLVPQVAPEEAMRLEVAKATGKETISFAEDIAPVLVDNCISCHAGQNPPGNLNMDTFAGLLRGGDGGPPITPKNAATSLLNEKIKGNAGDRMPLRKPPLSDEVIAKFDKWVAEGGTFDGTDAGMTLTRLVAIVFAQNATHEELSKRRAELAATTWRLAIPDDKAQSIETKNFLVMGNVDEQQLQEIGEKAEKQVAAVAKFLKAPTEPALIKGRMTLFVFRQRFDYTEFGRMVEKRELPGDWVGHGRFDIVNAYGCVVPPQDTEYSLDAVIAQGLAGVYVATTGKAPEWFAEGVGRAIAAKISPKDPRVMAWESYLPTAINSAGNPAALLAGTLPPEDSAVLSYSFVKYLMGSSTKFSALLFALKQGQGFDQALMKHFGGTPQQLVMDWGPKALSKKRGRP